jgi:hypothetical protein
MTLLLQTVLFVENGAYLVKQLDSEERNQGNTIWDGPDSFLILRQFASMI